MSGSRSLVLDHEFVGQGRALKGLRRSLSLRGPGAHIVLAGPPGSGRRTLIESLLEDHPWPFEEARDWLLVYDFGQHQARVLQLPAGEGPRFQRSLGDFFGLMRQQVNELFESEELPRRRDDLHKRLERQEKALFAGLLETARAQGFAIPRPLDGDVMFVLDGQMKSRQRMLELHNRGQIKIRYKQRTLKRHRLLTEELRACQKRARQLQRETPKSVREAELQSLNKALRPHIQDLTEDTPQAAPFFESYVQGVHQHLALLIDDDEPDDAHAFMVFHANLLLTRAAESKPVEFLQETKVQTLFGGPDGDRVHAEAPEFHKMRAGAVHRAEGGLLVLEARELLQDSAALKALRRFLHSGQEPNTFKAVEPSAYLGLKIVLLGDEHDTHQLLYEEDLGEVFKVKVEMDTSVSDHPDSVLALAKALLTATRRAGLAAMEAEALESVMDFATRSSGQQRRLNLQMGQLLDLIREAEVIAAEQPRPRRRAGPPLLISRWAVREALRTRKERQSLMARQHLAQISSGVVLIDTQGRRVGQVNALLVYESGRTSFSRPCRVTATVAMGWQGLIDIERESSLSGETHHKGVQIISGLLRHRYATTKPLALTASVCFEQSYTPIDGDSASAAEVVAVLSAIARVPVRQGFALTGSLNQLGDLQAVGAVNDKIEGFFDVCKCADQGLSGEQGVIIPDANVADLCLREDVLEAIDAGLFHIYAAATLDEVLGLLTGLEAGSKSAREHYPEKSFNARVDERLTDFASRWKDFQRVSS